MWYIADIHVNITEDVSVSQSTQNNQVLEKGESHLKISQSKNLVADSTTAVSGETKSAKVEEESVQLQKDKITTNLLSTIEQEISEEEVLFEVLPLETSNSVLPQHQTVRSRDVIFDRCLQSRVETLQLKSNQRNERFKTEERWKNSWVKTLEDICSFYEWLSKIFLKVKIFQLHFVNLSNFLWSFFVKLSSNLNLFIVTVTLKSWFESKSVK